MKAVGLRNVMLGWKNFSGAETLYTSAGIRDFHVVIEDATLADELKKLGWNIKPRAEEDGANVLKIAIKTEHPDISYLDSCTNRVDVDFYPRYWEHQGRSGITATLIDIRPVLKVMN